MVSFLFSSLSYFIFLFIFICFISSLITTTLLLTFCVAGNTKDYIFDPPVDEEAIKVRKIQEKEKLFQFRGDVIQVVTRPGKNQNTK